MLRTAFMPIAICASVVMTAAVSPSPSPRAAPVLVSSAILQRVAATGHAQVIVGLTGAFAPEGMLQGR